MTSLPAFNIGQFLSALIRIPSCDPPGGELEVARLVHRQLLDLGIEAEFDEFAPGRANVVGRIAGAGTKPPLVFSAHMDTVPEGQQPWSFPPFAGDNVAGMIRGRGASDMKSAIAAFVGAAHQISVSQAPLAGDILLAFTAGESANCIGARRLVEQGFQSRIGAFLCGEPSTLDLIVVEKAILWLHAEATGTLGHVSGAAGVNAINLMAQFLTQLTALELDLPAHPLLSPPSISVGRIQGGSAVNLTPDKCVAEIDVRFGPGVSPEQVIAQIAPILPAEVSLEMTDFKPAVEESPGSEFVQLCEQACLAENGHMPKILGVSYYSDGAILLDGLDVPFIILGPGLLGMSGQRDEVIPADNLHKAVRIYTQIARQWLQP